MKKIYGIDLGTTSIGWSVINEAENETEQSSIIGMGVRVVPLTTDEKLNFEKGKTITTNADRTQKRGARRNLQRYKLRRKYLKSILIKNQIIKENTVLAEDGQKSTHSILKLRADSVEKKINLEDFGRVLFAINKKRGYKSNRKANSVEEGDIIDAMGIAITLHNERITPGQFVHKRINEEKFSIPDFYRSDLENEFKLIWKTQGKYLPQVFTEFNLEELTGKTQKETGNYFTNKLNIQRAEFKGNRIEKVSQIYQWRAKAVMEKIDPEITAEVLIDINRQINSSSGYLGKIGDRSKILAFNNLTVGQYLYNQILTNPNTSLKNQVFYRKDYEDEFEKIWKTQERYHPELNSKIKNKIKHEIIFYQRPLKSQKGLISLCEFENKEIVIEVNGKPKKQKVGNKVAPKSSPVYQEFKIWQIINNVKVKVNNEPIRMLNPEEKLALYYEMSIKEKVTKAEISKVFGHRKDAIEMVNYFELSGNTTKAKLFKGFNQIIEFSGHDKIDLKLNTAKDIIHGFSQIFETLGINSNIAEFSLDLDDDALIKQPYFELWHLLYSYEGDDSRSGNESLLNKLREKFGFDEEGAIIMSKIKFELDYGDLSTKAMKKIIPYLRQGHEYSKACQMAGYNHSHSLTSEQNIQRSLNDKMELVPKNSLRNPVVEKILNQMVHVVNQLIEEYGKADEVRIELARDLKKNAKQRERLTSEINKAKKTHEQIKEIIKNEFGLTYVSRNDIIKYKLYKELAENGYKTLYNNKKIDHEKLFSKEIDVEHIIPKARLFDDSFSNKTLEFRSVNLMKGNLTAYDYVAGKSDSELNQYIARVKSLSGISTQKKKLLLMTEQDIPDNPLERDLRNTQYIAKKALSMLHKVFRNVVPTTGKITQRLRTDWQLIDVLKELNWTKFDKLGLTYFIENNNGQKLSRIKDWDKRNDHRHHAMDALAVAFTTRNHIQYLNNLNAESVKGRSIYGIRNSMMLKDGSEWKFKPPIFINELRKQAKEHLSNILVSHKVKNKVVTKNSNMIKSKKGVTVITQLTPRGSLHNETLYGTAQLYETKEMTVNNNFDAETINKVAKKIYRDALLNRFEDYKRDPKKAFSGKNSLTKNPIYLDEFQMSKVPDKVKLVWKETIFTVRKKISPDLNVDKVIDPTIQKILEDRLKKFNNDKKKAFSNLDEDPIWFNKEKGIKVKNVKISAVSNAIPIHTKRNHIGEIIVNTLGIPEDSAFVTPGNNHHIAIYRDEEDKLYEEVVTFFEAVLRKNQNLPVINPVMNNGAKLLFTLKQNELFVFSNIDKGFDPFEIDLMNQENYQDISPNLFRVQKIASKYYVFRHHLETELKDDNNLQGITWHRIQSLTPLLYIQKVRINHLGKIVQISEF